MWEIAGWFIFEREFLDDQCWVSIENEGRGRGRGNESSAIHRLEKTRSLVHYF